MTDFAKLRELLLEYSPELKLTENALMAEHTSFRIGGRAALMAEPADVTELKWCLRAARKAGVSPFILGRGSNVLAADGEIDRFIVKTFPGAGKIRYEGEGLIYAECGATLAQVANFALERGLTGFEFAQGIPGTVGGAVRMNAGAFDGEISRVLVATVYLDREANIHTLTNAEHEFSHRHSVFAENGGVVLGCTLQLSPGDPEEIRAKMADFAARRLATQPLDKPSAGSSFKRPERGYASAMIDQCGLKGLTVGGAQVSEKHAGFIVNLGGASCADVTELMEQVADRVEARFGLRLEPEIVRLS